jgi:hypothetical protein
MPEMQQKRTLSPRCSYFRERPLPDIQHPGKPTKADIERFMITGGDELF